MMLTVISYDRHIVDGVLAGVTVRSEVHYPMERHTARVVDRLKRAEQNNEQIVSITGSRFTVSNIKVEQKSLAEIFANCQLPITRKGNANGKES